MASDPTNAPLTALSMSTSNTVSKPASDQAEKENSRAASAKPIRSMEDMKTWKDFVENLDLVPDGTKIRIGNGDWVELHSKNGRNSSAPEESHHHHPGDPQQTRQYSAPLVRRGRR